MACSCVFDTPHSLISRHDESHEWLDCVRLQKSACLHGKIVHQKCNGLSLGDLVSLKVHVWGSKLCALRLSPGSMFVAAFQHDSYRGSLGRCFGYCPKYVWAGETQAAQQAKFGSWWKKTYSCKSDCELIAAVGLLNCASLLLCEALLGNCGSAWTRGCTGLPVRPGLAGGAAFAGSADARASELLASRYWSPVFATLPCCIPSMWFMTDTYQGASAIDCHAPNKWDELPVRA